MGHAKARDIQRAAAAKDTLLAATFEGKVGLSGGKLLGVLRTAAATAVRGKSVMDEIADQRIAAIVGALNTQSAEAIASLEAEVRESLSSESTVLRVPLGELARA